MMRLQLVKEVKREIPVAGNIHAVASNGSKIQDSCAISQISIERKSTSGKRTRTKRKHVDPSRECLAAGAPRHERTSRNRRAGNAAKAPAWARRKVRVARNHGIAGI